MVDGELLRFLIGQIAQTYKLDARAYREDNDVLTDLNWGDTSSAAIHFAQSGFLSGLVAQPRNFDEDWYLATYPDVRKEVSAGVFRDALAHYQAKGRAEFRSPNAAAAAQVRAWRSILISCPNEEAVQLQSVSKHTTTDEVDPEC